MGKINHSRYVSLVMPVTAMDFDFTGAMPPELDLAVMVIIFVDEGPAMGAMTSMPTAVVGNHVPFAVSAAAPRMMAAAAFFRKT